MYSSEVHVYERCWQSLYNQCKKWCLLKQQCNMNWRELNHDLKWLVQYIQHAAFNGEESTHCTILVTIAESRKNIKPADVRSIQTNRNSDTQEVVLRGTPNSCVDCFIRSFNSDMKMGIKRCQRFLKIHHNNTKFWGILITIQNK